MVGTGQGPGLSPETIGEQSGSSTVTLHYGQTPANNLNPFGQSQSFDNRQPSLGITYEIATLGVFPAPGGGGIPLDTLGMIMAFAGTFDAGGYMACDGRLLAIAHNDALFNLLGTTYGGDGVTTFALPDLRGRNIIGASAADPIGTVVGHDNVTLTNVQTPSGPGPAAVPFDNRQPSLAMEYLIALQGIFPSQPPLRPSGWRQRRFSVRSSALPEPSSRAVGLSAMAACCRSTRTRRCSRCWGRSTAATG